MVGWGEWEGKDVRVYSGCIAIQQFDYLGAPALNLDFRWGCGEGGPACV